MTNELATVGAGGAVASLKSLKSGLQNVKDSIPQTGGMPFLRLLKDGIWVYGQEDLEVEEGSRWAINPFSIEHGYVCWSAYDDEDKNNEVLGEAMRPATEPKPDKASLADYSFPWKDQYKFDLVCTNGEDKGTQVVYKIGSVGGINAVNEVISRIMAQLDVDETKPVPVVTLDRDSYKHKKWGKIYNPIFSVVEWVALTDALPTEGTSAEAEANEDAPETPQETPAKEPARRQRRTAKPKETAAKSEEPADAAGEPGAAEAATASPAGAPRRRRRVAA